jgi:hypothetical protein
VVAVQESKSLFNACTDSFYDGERMIFLEVMPSCAVRPLPSASVNSTASIVLTIDNVKLVVCAAMIYFVD